eukprot:13043127-Alexandrium_andersonii.AAC.1
MLGSVVGLSHRLRRLGQLRRLRWRASARPSSPGSRTARPPPWSPSPRATRSARAATTAALG